LETGVNSLEEEHVAAWELKSDFAQMKLAMEVMSAKQQRYEMKQKALCDEITNLKAYSMKHNLIFTIDEKLFPLAKETRGENCVGIIRQFMFQEMGVPETKNMFITVSHRLGTYRAGHSRPIIAVFPISEQMDNVLKHANRLRGKTHYVSRQMPPAQKERNQFAYPEFKELKDDPSKKARLTNGRLFVQGKEQIKYSLSVLPVIDPGHSMESSFSASDECDDEQNVFRGYASKVTSLTDISAVRQELLRDSKVSSSHHLIMAYRIKLDGGTLCENFDSDGDHGTGIELLK
jgi:hypothetical protein